MDITMQIEKTYHINDFEKIFWQGYQYSLSQETMDIINELAEKVGAPNYIKTPVFTKNIRVKKKDKVIVEDDWHAIRQFKTTVIKKAEGIDKRIDEVRSLLNKISEKNYDQVCEEIESKLNDSNCEDFTDEELDKLIRYIFKTASSNKFYSNIYAKLIVNLLDKFQSIKNLFNSNKHNYMNQFDNIEFCDPNTDYDRFCENNLVNDQRRASSLFLINLMKLNVIVPQEIINLIISLQEMIEKIINETDKSQVIEEISENLFILVKNGYNEIKNLNDWKGCYKYIEKISKLNIKEYKSLNNKIKFKHMDMLDHFKKNE